MKNRIVAALVVVLVATPFSQAAEPNETFDAATVLSPGTLTVSDQLTIGGGGGDLPDTLIGLRDQFGQIYDVREGDFGYAMVPTNNGSINFSITGAGDDDFVGSHSESGAYEVFVDAYDFFGDLVDSFSEVRTLAPGVVHDFDFDNFEWIGGNYDVYVDTPDTGEPSDVDFFSFTGLTPGTQFSARTADPNANGIDTYLGWFSSSGTLIEANDDEDFNSGIITSLIEGNVPSNGMLTFAVTGFGDDFFNGEHSEVGTYELRLQLDSVPLVGDYNQNGTVDAADYVVWRKTLNQTGSGLPADGNNNNQVDPGDYAIWRANFGRTATGAAAGLTSTAVPEPASLALCAIAAAGALIQFHQRRLR